MSRVQRRSNGEAGGGAATRSSTRSSGCAGSAATGETEGSNAICSGATICAENSPRAGMGALRWQQGATGSCRAGPCWRAADDPAPWFIIAQREQPELAAIPAELQSASPSAGAISTARSSPEAMSLRNCMPLLYTSCQSGVVMTVTPQKIATRWIALFEPLELGASSRRNGHYRPSGFRASNRPSATTSLAVLPAYHPTRVTSKQSKSGT